MPQSLLSETNKKTTKIFISYKTGGTNGLTYNANSLYRELERLGYNPWMDDRGLEAGLEWNQQLYKQITDSDILIVLLAREVKDSEWVRREVDVARGAKIRILPVLIRDDFETKEERQALFDKLDFNRTQYIPLLTGSQAEFEKLVDQIELQEGKTLRDQESWLKERQERYKGTAVKPARKAYATFKLVWSAEKASDDPDDLTTDLDDSQMSRRTSKPTKAGQEKPCQIHLAVGDMLRLRNIDVFVNSENAYLQMARIFESKTVSALLRYYGSYIDEGGHLAEDCVQDEMEAQIQANTSLMRPVGVGTVLVTSAGHPESVLRKKNKARYIFHTVTVSVNGDGTERTLEPAKSDSSIWQAVYNTLSKVDEVNRLKGVVAPMGYHYKTAQDGKSKETDLRKEQEAAKESYKPITSIILPLYASGHGGRNAGEVMTPLVEGIRDYLTEAYQREHDEKDQYKCTLKHIHLVVFHKEYVELMRKKLQTYFRETKAPDEIIT